MRSWRMRCGGLNAPSRRCGGDTRRPAAEDDHLVLADDRRLAARLADVFHRRASIGKLSHPYNRKMLQSNLRFAPAEVNVEKRPDGSMVLRSPQKLGAYARCVTEWLVHWSDHQAERIFLAERAADGWRRMSYRESYGAVRRIGQALLNLGLNQERPVAILSDNSV